MAIPRSYLFAPGDKPELLRKAAGSIADAVIVDLEDAVAPDAKVRARQGVGAFFDEVAARDEPARVPEIWLRINSGDLGRVDLAAAWRPVIGGIVVAKAEKAGDLEGLDRQLATLEAEAGAAVGSTRLMPMIESAGATLAAASLAAHPRVDRMTIGEVDLASELGIDPREDGEHVLVHARSTIVLASAASRLDPPVGPVSVDYRDLDGFRLSTTRLAAMGFVGRACIHPAQVAVANAVFTPDPDDIDRARAVVREFDASGGGVAVGADGSMVDEAVIRRARRMVRTAGREGGRTKICRER